MSVKVVQDSDEEDAEYSASSPTEHSKCRNGSCEIRAGAGDSHHNSSDSLEGKIDDIQKFLLQDIAAQKVEDIFGEKYQSDKGSLILPLPKRRRLSQYSNISRYYSEDPNILLEQDRHISLKNKSSAGYELAGTNFQICSQPLTFKDAPIISKTGDVESLGDGSSTIPYGSLTQRMLMDQAIADPNPQLELSTWGDTRSNDIVEDNSLPSPLSSPCTQQKYQKDAIQSPTVSSQPNMDTGCELLSPSKTSHRMLDANLVTSSKPMIPLGRKKRFDTEPMHDTSKLKDDSDDELSFSAGILSAIPYKDAKNIKAGATSCFKINTRHNNEPDDINVHDHIPKCALDQTRCDLPHECYIPRPTRSRSRPIKVEEVDYSQSPEKISRKQHRKGFSSESADPAVYNNPPLECDGSYVRDNEDHRLLSTKQKMSYKHDQVETKMPVSGECASACSQDTVQIVSKSKIKHLAEMGFCFVKAEEALRSHDGHMDKAIQQLLELSNMEHKETGLKDAVLQDGTRRTSKRFKKGRKAIENDELIEKSISAPDQTCCTPEFEEIPSRVIKTAHVEIYNSMENLSRDNIYTKVNISSQEPPNPNQTSDSNGNFSASNIQLSNNENSRDFNDVMHLKEFEHVQNIKNETSEDKNSNEETSNTLDNELPEKRRRGRPRKKAKAENLKVVPVHEDPPIQAEDLTMVKPSPDMDRSLTPIPDYNNNSIDTRRNEGCLSNVTDDPKTPSSKSHAGINSSPLTIEKSKQIRKQDQSRMSDHSPLSKSHVPYRVGLSRSAKITPLLRSLKK